MKKIHITSRDSPDNQPEDDLAKENIRLKQEIAELKESAEVQSSLYQIAELYSAIFRMADITNNAKDMGKFGTLLHGALRELISTENFYIAFLNQNSDSVSYPYFSDEMRKAPEPHGRDGSFFSFIAFSDTPVILPEERIKALADESFVAVTPPVPSCCVAVPFFAHGLQSGSIVITSYDPAKIFGPKEMDLLIFVGRHIGSILERRLVQEFLIKSREELEATVVQRTAEITKANEMLRQEITMREEIELLQSALSRVADLAMDTLEPEELYNGLHAIIGNVVYAKNFSVALYDEEHLVLEYPFFYDETGFSNPAENKMFTSLNRFVLGTQKPVYFSRSTLPSSFIN
ncbi:MAG: GAF domain-containing protein, partial [Spirochaetota bacterium]